MNDGQVLHLQQMINCKTQPFFPGPTRDSVKVNAKTWWNLKQSDPQHVKMWILSSIWSMLTHTIGYLEQNKAVIHWYEWVKDGILWLAQVQSEYITFHLVAKSVALLQLVKFTSQNLPLILMSCLSWNGMLPEAEVTREYKAAGCRSKRLQVWYKKERNVMLTCIFLFICFVWDIFSYMLLSFLTTIY